MNSPLDNNFIEQRRFITLAEQAGFIFQERASNNITFDEQEVFFHGQGNEVLVDLLVPIGCAPTTPTPPNP